MEMALALKYRPRRFEDLIGQDSISQTLSLALDSKRLSHAYLFSGLRGSGKTSTARIFSKALNCINGPTSKPCDVCDNCIAANSGRHIDIIEMDAASSRKIDDIRELIEHTKYKPSTGKYKIFIIDEVHMLTKEAFNALLKTLEEPPNYVKFILATTDPLKLPATILSRTQHFRFKKIAKNDIVHHLETILAQENIEYQNDALEIIARSGGGSLRDTLTMLDQAIIFSKNSIDTNSVTDMLGLVDPEFIKGLFDAIFLKDMQKIKELVFELENYEAEMVLDEISQYLKDKLFMVEGKDLKFSPLVLDRFFRIISDSKVLLNLNSDGSFVLLLTFLKMVEALNIKDVDEMIEEIESEIDISKPKPAAPKDIDNSKKEQNKESAKSVEKSKELQNQKRFELLIEKIYDRSFDCGECFSQNIGFVSFEDNTLTWRSKADGSCKELLRDSYGIIKHFVQDIYGFETKIKHTIWEIEDSDDDKIEKSTEVTQESPAQSDTSDTEEEQKKNDNLEEKKSEEELFKERVLNDLYVKTTDRLFGIKSVKVIRWEQGDLQHLEKSPN